MEQICIGQWEIEFDRNKTIEYYKDIDTLEFGCTCRTCVNYCIAVKDFPNEVTRFFDSLGLDLIKPTEVYGCMYENGKVEYGGFYHLVGSYISGEDIWQGLSNGGSTFKFELLAKIVEDYGIGFTKETVMVPNNFPMPVLQMEIIFMIPWLIDEPY
ncbi:MAG: hypothetical protein FWG88_10975 [Oscillospiraceae bacterium]|nr:hypothetical protein [Oscillospiraceae bacterium]